MNRTTLILLGVLVVLAAATVIVFQRPGERSLSESGTAPFLAVDSANVTAISIVSDGSMISLGKRGTEWVIEGSPEYRADPGAVAGLLKEISGLSVRSIVSSKPEKHALFQVDTSGTMITLRHSSGDPLSFFLGKTAPGFSEVYARREGSDDVVLIAAAASYAARRPAEEWRDKAMVRIPTDQIREITFQYGDTTFTLAWQDSAWSIDGSPVQERAVNSIVTTLSEFRADDFVDAPPSSIRRPEAIISFAGVALRLYHSRGEDHYLAQSSSSSQWYRVAGWKARQVLKRKADLISLQ